MYRPSMRSMGCLIALIAMSLVVLGSASAQASSASFLGLNGGIALAYHANMDAQQMADAGTPGEPGATGTAHLSLDASAGTICFLLFLAMSVHVPFWGAVRREHTQ